MAAFTTTPREAKVAFSAQPTGCDLLGRRGDGPLQIISQHYDSAKPQRSGTAHAGRRVPMKRRLLFAGLVLAIVLLAVGGWAVDAFRFKGD